MLKMEFQRIVQSLRRNNLPSVVIQNHIKEYLQLCALNFIYNSSFNKKFIFTGGTCLRICYGLNRLSEDIDFDIIGELDIEAFAKGVYEYFTKELQHREIELVIKGRGDKIYLKFPILHVLGLSQAGESDKLYVKIETTPVSSKSYTTELTSIDRERFNFLAKHYDLPNLMAGKINAVLHRVYFKGEKNEITFKGRDVYDLIWFLERGVRPNMERVREFTDIETEKALFKKIYEKISNYKSEYLFKDLENLFDNRTFIRNWVDNFKVILSKHIETT